MTRPACNRLYDALSRLYRHEAWRVHDLLASAVDYTDSERCELRAASAGYTAASQTLLYARNLPVSTACERVAAAMRQAGAPDPLIESVLHDIGG